MSVQNSFLPFSLFLCPCGAPVPDGAPFPGGAPPPPPCFVLVFLDKEESRCRHRCRCRCRCRKSDCFVCVCCDCCCVCFALQRDRKIERLLRKRQDSGNRQGDQGPRSPTGHHQGETDSQGANAEVGWYNTLSGIVVRCCWLLLLFSVGGCCCLCYLSELGVICATFVCTDARAGSHTPARITDTPPTRVWCCPNGTAAVCMAEASS